MVTLATGLAAAGRAQPPAAFAPGVAAAAGADTDADGAGAEAGVEPGAEAAGGRAGEPAATC
ncbi:hypothetical protein GCM10025331_30660 [Actinoplanes utahensis]|nr:hypothetical protein Aut01nite_32380 [Actinoplanes utahensis]